MFPNIFGFFCLQACSGQTFYLFSWDFSFAGKGETFPLCSAAAKYCSPWDQRTENWSLRRGSGLRHPHNVLCAPMWMIDSLWGQMHPDLSRQHAACLYTLGDKRLTQGSAWSRPEDTEMHLCLLASPQGAGSFSHRKHWEDTSLFNYLYISGDQELVFTTEALAPCVTPVLPKFFPHTLLHPSQDQTHQCHAAKPFSTPAKTALASCLRKLCRAMFILIYETVTLQARFPSPSL